LFVVPAQGGAPRPLAAGLRIFNRPVPSPQLRWSPDGASVSLLAFTGDKPQVFAIPLSGAAPRALTSAGEGVAGFEWSPDGKRLAYLTLDAMSAEEAQRRRDQSFVIHADAPTRPTRLVVHTLDGSGSAPVLTPASQYVDSLSWSPDGREIAYSAAS